MREVDSAALRWVERALGVGRPTSTGMAYFDGDVLQQSWDIGALISRGVTPPQADGIWTLAFENEHAAGADSVLTSSFNPFDVEGTCAGAAVGVVGDGFPGITDQFDIWLLNCSAYLVTGVVANFDAALLDVILPSNSNAYSCTAASGATRAIALASYDVGIATGIGNPQLAERGTGQLDKRLGFRMPRGSLIRWRSRNKNITAIDVQVNIAVAVVAKGAGPDAV